MLQLSGFCCLPLWCSSGRSVVRADETGWCSVPEAFLGPVPLSRGFGDCFTYACTLRSWAYSYNDFLKLRMPRFALICIILLLWAPMLVPGQLAVEVAPM